jgi:hypothetical protein
MVSGEREGEGVKSGAVLQRVVGANWRELLLQLRGVERPVGQFGVVLPLFEEIEDVVGFPSGVSLKFAEIVIKGVFFFFLDGRNLGDQVQ